MGIKNIYERFIWFDNQVRARKYPDAEAKKIAKFIKGVTDAGLL